MTVMMQSVFVSMMLLGLGLVLNLSLVIGDCYDDAENNKSYNNCATCFQTLANALINTGDNKYQLSNTFFPTADVSPAQVTVTYVFLSNDSSTAIEEKWYWLNGGFYVYQPLQIFFYRSLMFSHPAWRRRSVTLYLPVNCLPTGKNNETGLSFLTQRVRISPLHYYWGERKRAPLVVLYVAPFHIATCYVSVQERMTETADTAIAGLINFSLLACSYLATSQRPAHFSRAHAAFEPRLLSR